MLKLDLHIHSEYSDDATGSYKEIIQNLQRKGLDGMALTDHNTVEGAMKAQEHAPKDFIVIPGIEVSTKDGHLLGLNVHEVIPKGLSVENTTERIIEAGGIAIVPHLYRNMSGIKKEKLMKIYQKIPAIEVFNSCSLPKTNLKTARVAREYDLGGTGGSDSHEPFYVGSGYTLVDTTDRSIDSILHEIEKKQTWGEGTTLPLEYRRNRMEKSLKQFFTRGFKRI
jgi:predicted metal-dependent phosphoesterase TrpH